MRSVIQDTDVEMPEYSDEGSLDRLLRLLRFEDREILKLRYGLNHYAYHYRFTLEEIGKTFRITRERVRQREVKALNKLRSLILTRGWRDRFGIPDAWSRF